MKTLLGLLLAFGLGFVCRMTDIPVPSPNRLLGALLVLFITLGYLFADRILSHRGNSQDRIDTADVLTQLPKEK